MYCSNCGTKNYDDAVYCKKCGSLIGSSKEESPKENMKNVGKKSVFYFYSKVWKNFAKFNGRAGIKEYWSFTLLNLIPAVLFGFFGGSISNEDPSLIESLFNLAILIPSLAVGVRRMHDADKSGWFLFLPLVNLYFLVKTGSKGNNRFGSAPE